MRSARRRYTTSQPVLLWDDILYVQSVDGKDGDDDSIVSAEVSGVVGDSLAETKEGGQR
jgi:hypothetical protein